MKKIAIFVIMILFLSSCANGLFKKQKDMKQIDPVDLLVKIIYSKDSEMLFDKDMVKFINYSQYSKEELIRISEALTGKIEILTIPEDKRRIKEGDMNN